ncbi:MAG TPA: hypothetical protein VFT51_11155, partial [Bacillales bacterium]|nr:hypothetical protein [Bacillales bacterium]
MTKSGMRGFAAGLWIAAIVMAYFFFTGQGPAESAAKQTITKEQVQHYLESHDQVAVEKETYESLKSTAADQKAENQNNDKTKSEEANTDQSKEDGKKNDEKSDESDEQQKSKDKAKTYTL